MKRALKRALVLCAVALTGVGSVALLSEARAEPPAAVARAAADVPVTADPDAIARLQLRADQAFAADDFETARELYKKLAIQLRGDEARLGPVLERVRVCDAMLAQAEAENPDAAGPQNATDPAKRTPHTLPADGQPYAVTIQQLGNFVFDPLGADDVPADVQALHGKTVQIVGYMIPMQQARQITQFALVPDLFQCCFGQPPQLHHTVIVNTPQGKSVPYFPEELVCTGTLRVKKQMEDGFVVGLFELDVTSVKPAPR
ncbi:MAG: DUF3299 domain-containing protein [Phycisphaerae bacterium]